MLCGGDGLAAIWSSTASRTAFSGLSQELLTQLKHQALGAVKFRESNPVWTLLPHCSGSVVTCWLLPEGLLPASSIYSVHEPLLGRPPGSLRATLATPFLLSSLLTVHFQNPARKPLSITPWTLFRALSSFEDPSGRLGEPAGLAGPECVRWEHC